MVRTSSASSSRRMAATALMLLRLSKPLTGSSEAFTTPRPSRASWVGAGVVGVLEPAEGGDGVDVVEVVEALDRQLRGVHHAEALTGVVDGVGRAVGAGRLGLALGAVQAGADACLDDLAGGLGQAAGPLGGRVD